MDGSVFGWYAVERFKRIVRFGFRTFTKFRYLFSYEKKEVHASCRMVIIIILDKMMKIAILTLALVACAAASGYVSEVWTREQEIANGVVHNKFSSPLPHTYVKDTPTSLNWGNMNGQNLITKNLNQHIPQYCKLAAPFFAPLSSQP